VGGSPEGIVTACAIKALGGHIQGRLWPRDDDERQRGIDAGLDMDRVYEAGDLVRGDNTIFVATGVTDGQLVDGVRREGGYIYTESVVLRGASGTLRRIASEHLVSKWLCRPLAEAARGIVTDPVPLRAAVRPAFPAARVTIVTGFVAVDGAARHRRHRRADR
jgi:hypothetical protein